MALFNKNKDKKLPITQMGIATVEEAPKVGQTGKIGREEVAAAESILRKYKDGKTALEQRIVENERWYKLQQWELLRKKQDNPNDPEPASAWLLNSIANKHADAMDNFPQPIVLPREQSDQEDAELISSILPVIHEQNDFEQTYSNAWWYKLKHGVGVYGVFWSNSKANGLGDIDIRQQDLLNLFWEPGIENIQDSRNLFNVGLVDKDIIVGMYPFMKDKMGGITEKVAQYAHDDSIDLSYKAEVVDWYYKRFINGRSVLHFCKYCNGEVLYASENDEEYEERGYYDHGQYPFVLDVLFLEADTPTGFGYLDVCKSPQIYVDKLDQAILKHAVMGSKPRFWVRGDGSVNEKEYADLSKDFVHYYGGGNPNDNIFPIQMPPVSEIYVAIRNMKIEELKETSGNRDFSQGGTASGVTAASAIAALQEAGSKLSRDMIKSSYRAFAKINTLCIELMRQFYTEERWFRVKNPMGQVEFKAFSGQQIAQKGQGQDFGVDMGYRVPIFDIDVKSEKNSPFSTVAQNERAKEMFAMGFFNPQIADQALACLEIMQFENIEAVRDRISQNGTMYQTLQQIIPIALQLAQMVDQMTGSAFTPQIAQIVGIEGGSESVPAGDVTGSETETNALGDPFNESMHSTAGKARQRVAAQSTPRA